MTDCPTCAAMARDLEASRLRQQRLRDRIDALEQALAGAQTLIAEGVHDAPPFVLESALSNEEMAALIGR